MPKYDATFLQACVLEVEAEDATAARRAVDDLLRGLSPEPTILKIIQTDPPLSLNALADAGEAVADQADVAAAPELPPPVRPVNCSTDRLDPW